MFCSIKNTIKVMYKVMYKVVYTANSLRCFSKKTDRNFITKVLAIYVEPLKSNRGLTCPK